VRDDVQGRYQELMGRLRARSDARDQKHAELVALKDQEALREERFRRSWLPKAQEACEARRWIRQNRDHFQGRVFGPIALELSVDNAQHAAVLESVLPAYTMTGEMSTGIHMSTPFGSR
jgi:hypothetical protein